MRQIVTVNKGKMTAMVIGIALAAGVPSDGIEPALLGLPGSLSAVSPLASVVRRVRCIPHDLRTPCFAPLGSVRSVSFVQAPAGPGAANGSVALAWDAPTDSSPPTSYIVEAGSAPGRSNVAVLDTGTGDTTLFVVGVPPGVYYVRVRARNAGGVSDPSNEITINVGGTSSVSATACAHPLPPAAVTATVDEGVVTVSWTGSPGATSYQIEAGAAPGASDLYNGDVGGLTTLRARVAPGDYFVRVRARAGCGISAPSNEVVIRVTP